MRKRYFVWIALILMLMVGLSVASLNKYRHTLPAATEANPLEGYWTQTATYVTAVYYNPYPTCAVYAVYMTLPKATGGTPITVDFPAWKHFGMVGSYHIEAVDTGSAWANVDDSLHANLSLFMVNSAVDTSGYGDAHLLKVMADSADGDGKGGIFLPGGYNTSCIDGEVDLTTEQDYWEHIRLSCMQTTTTANASATCKIKVILVLPYSTAYLSSEYYKKNEVVK
jgi:hypothetical protein